MAATNASAARKGVLEMLIEDQVKKMFRDFEKKNHKGGGRSGNPAGRKRRNAN